MLRTTTFEELERMAEFELEAAASLASSDIDLLCYGCTIGPWKDIYRSLYEQINQCEQAGIVTTGLDRGRKSCGGK
jgi:maleate cis-trans isomerase